MRADLKHPGKRGPASRIEQQLDAVTRLHIMMLPPTAFAEREGFFTTIYDVDFVRQNNCLRPNPTQFSDVGGRRIRIPPSPGTAKLSDNLVPLVIVPSWLPDNPRTRIDRASRI